MIDGKKFISAGKSPVATDVKDVGGWLSFVAGEPPVWLAIVLIFLAAGSAGFHLFSSQLLLGHDSRAAFIRVLGMQEYFGSGQWFVRWFPDLNWGYGGPTFNFYPPLFYFITMAASSVLGNASLSVNLTLFVLWALSGVSMFFLVRHYWGWWAGLVSAVAYIYAPYHVVDVYTRGAYAEFTAFALLPFILLSLSRLVQTRKMTWFFSLALSLAGLFLAHNATCLIFMPFIVLYVILVLTMHAAWKWRTVLLLGWALLLGTAMASFFWFPALQEKSALRTDFLVGGRYAYWKNFLDGTSLGVWPFSSTPVQRFDGISFDIGGWHVVLVLLTIVFFVGRVRKAGEFLRAGFFIVMILLALFLSLAVSRPVWERLPLLQFLQFPWRFLVLVSLGLSVLAGGWLWLVEDRRLRTVGALIAIAVLVISGMRSLAVPRMQAPPSSPRQTQIFTSLFLGEGEYTPRWIERPPSVPARQRVWVAAGQVKIADAKAISKVEHTFVLQAASPALLVANIFYYPGWHVYVDGQDTSISADPVNGRIVFPVPSGEHRVRIKLELTAVQFWSMVISWSALIFLLASGCWLGRYGQTKGFERR